MFAKMPNRLTRTYIAVLIGLLLFLCTVQLLRSGASPSATQQSPTWKQWMWPSQSLAEESTRVVKATPPIFSKPMEVRPAQPKGKGAKPEGVAQENKWSKEASAPPDRNTPSAPSPPGPPPPTKHEDEHKEEGEQKQEENVPECPSGKAWKADALPALNTTFRVAENIHYSPKGPDPSQIVMVTATDGKGHNGGIEDIIGQTSANRQAYCDHHGYNHHFVNISKFDVPGAHPVWKKIPAIVDAFNTYPNAQWVFFLDLDAIIMSPKQDLNSLALSHAGLGKSLDFGQMYHGSEWTPMDVYMPKQEDVRFEDIDMLVAQDHNGVNAGSFFLRRSKYTQWLLDMWADPFFMHMDWPGQEQDTLLHFIKHHKTFRQHLGLIKQRTANAYTEGNEAMKWQAGDLVVHFAGCWVDDKCQERWQQFWNKRGTLDEEY